MIAGGLGEATQSSYGTSKTANSLDKKKQYIYIYRYIERHILSFAVRSRSPEPVPAPDTGIVTHSYEDTAVSAEAGLSNCSSAFRVSKSRTPVAKIKTKSQICISPLPSGLTDLHQAVPFS